MRKIIISVHLTLDGYVAGPGGEMDWIRLDEEMFDQVARITDEADTALYGRTTYEMMDSYWPDAGDKPNASRHDIVHSRWYNTVNKIVLSRTLSGKGIYNTTFISDHISEEINRLKQQAGKNILIFGSPGAAHSLMEDNLIDEYWLFVNPVILGKGIPLFEHIKQKISLTLQSTLLFKCGVVGLHYTKLAGMDG